MSEVACQQMWYNANWQYIPVFKYHVSPWIYLDRWQIPTPVDFQRKRSIDRTVGHTGTWTTYTIAMMWRAGKSAPKKDFLYLSLLEWHDVLQKICCKSWSSLTFANGPAAETWAMPTTSTSNPQCIISVLCSTSLLFLLCPFFILNSLPFIKLSFQKLSFYFFCGMQ